MTELDGLFAPIDPPPGGLDGLRAKLAAERRRRVVGVGAVALAAAALLVLRPTPAPPVDHPSLATVSGAVEGRGGTVVQVLSADAGVVVALVAPPRALEGGFRQKPAPNETPGKEAPVE